MYQWQQRQIVSHIPPPRVQLWLTIWQSYPQVIHRFSTGYPQLLTSCGQLVHNLWTKVIHNQKLSTGYPQVFHRRNQSYPQVYPHGPERPSEARHGVLTLGYAMVSTKVFSSFCIFGVDKCVDLCWTLWLSITHARASNKRQKKRE